MRPDIDFTGPLAQHRFYRITIELFHQADLTSLHELFPPSSFCRRGALLLRSFGAERPHLSRRGPTVAFRIHFEPLAGRGQAGGNSSAPDVTKASRAGRLTPAGPSHPL